MAEEGTVKWWRPRRRTAQVIERAEKASINAEDTFKLLATTVVRLHRTTRELEQALKELNHDE
jgi:hypothetical protein